MSTPVGLSPETSNWQGILRCARYAFGPNRLHYCGPDVGHEVAAHLAAKDGDLGLQHILGQFRTLYPYLRLIAEANKIMDPFDERVIEAYWLGNKLLEAVSRRQLYNLLLEGQHLKDKLGNKLFNRVTDTLGQVAVPHHSFHVLDVWRHTGHHDQPQTVATLAECLISWGTVTAIDGPTITVKGEYLSYRAGQLYLAELESRSLRRRLEADYEIEQLKTGDIITIHWGVPCEIINSAQAASLKAYTWRHLQLANQTI